MLTTGKIQMKTSSLGKKQRFRLSALNLILLSLSALTLSNLSLANDCPRIISQSPYITHQLNYLGLKTCIVGSSRYDKALNLPSTGGLFDPDKTAIKNLQADLWITSDWTKIADFNTIKPFVKQALRLESFTSMQQIESNLTEIAKVSGHKNAQKRAEQFPRLWRAKVAEIKIINSAHPKTLLISSCSGQPYAFGKQSWLADLFSHAGFEIIGNQQRITHLPISKLHDQLEELIAQTQPQLVFIFERQLAPACRLMKLPKGTKLVTLDGSAFLQPAPILLTGLEKLKHNALWQ